MTTLPIRRMILYKHGVGYFERRGNVSGTTLQLSFPRAAMDDVLKSLVALDLGTGQVIGIDFETPEDRAALLAKGSIHLSDQHSLLDLLRDLRGRRVRCVLAAEDAEEIALEGLVIGVDYEDAKPLRRALVALYLPAERHVRALPLDEITRLDLLDDAAHADLSYFLRAAQSEEDRRNATLQLTAGEHELLVGYIAPAPAWRVSYRMLFETSDDQPVVLLQGWGLVDNQLDEDLEQVGLTLVAGMPISFRYRLYAPKTPERPLVEDEERTIEGPIAFGGAPPAPAPAMAAAGRQRAGRAEFAAMMAEDQAAYSTAEMEESVQVAAIGDERGALFAYQVDHPVSVARGQSAMVPILSRKLPCKRDLLYNGRKLPNHPVASLRLTNETGLTLERGPVTVLEGGDYAGEAVVPFTRSNAELIVPYAVELGISVHERQNHERQLAGLVISGEYLLLQEYELWHTLYELTSTLDRAATVTIEHVPRNGYELSETRAPDEQAADFLRWHIGCAAHARSEFTIIERRMLSRRELVRSLNAAQLQRFLRDRFLDQATYKRLEAVLQLYRQVEAARRRLSTLDKERDAVYKEQSQIQGNLQPLGRDGDEGALRARYVGDLNRLADRLGAIGREEQDLQQRITQLEQAATNELKELSNDDRR